MSIFVALAAGIAVAAPAGARQFQMSGTWVYRTGGIFLPLQFATRIMDMSGFVIHASMGNLTGARGTPNGPIGGSGAVTATGSAPATLRIPPHRFVEDAMALVPLEGVTAVQVTTDLGIDAPYAAATLAPGGGPGSFTWCPGDPGCVAGGGMRPTDWPGPGRVIYRAGANRFGGAMQLGLRRGGIISSVFRPNPLRVLQIPLWGVGSTLRTPAVGALGSADLPARQTVFLPRHFLTRPTMAPVPPPCCPSRYPGPILYPGPKVTTMQGVTTTGTGALFYFPTTPIATGPMGTLAGQYTTHYGFGQTTGTVIAQQTWGSSGQDFFTVMGSDQRTPLGAGNLSLVAGGLGFRNTGYPRSYFASFQKVSLTLGAPIPSLSPAGLAAVAALVLLVAGWALRRRRA